MVVKLYDRWGGIKPGEYTCVAKNYDHYVIRWRGKNYCVPSNLFFADPRVITYYEDEN